MVVIRDMELGTDIRLIVPLIEKMLQIEDLKSVDLDTMIQYYVIGIIQHTGMVSFITDNSGIPRSYIFYESRGGLKGKTMVIGQVYSGKPGDGVLLVRRAENKARELGISVMKSQVSVDSYVAKCRLFSYEAESVLIRRNL